MNEQVKVKHYCADSYCAKEHIQCPICFWIARDKQNLFRHSKEYHPEVMIQR